MCYFLGISRAAYYAWVNHLKQPDPDQARMELVQEAYQKSRRTCGYRRITLWLRKNKGIFINHKAVLRLMDKLNIHSVARKRKVHIRLNELETYHRYRNVLKRDFKATRPNHKWVTDVTYIHT
jgi:putative transposase